MGRIVPLFYHFKSLFEYLLKFFAVRPFHVLHRLYDMGDFVGQSVKGAIEFRIHGYPVFLAVMACPAVCKGLCIGVVVLLTGRRIISSGILILYILERCLNIFRIYGGYFERFSWSAFFRAVIITFIALLCHIPFAVHKKTLDSAKGGCRNPFYLRSGFASLQSSVRSLQFFPTLK